jgi:hypothetical protein
MITCVWLNAAGTPGTVSGEPSPHCACVRACLVLAALVLGTPVLAALPLAALVLVTAVLAALAGAAEASSPAETPSEPAATSSAQAIVLSRRPRRGVSHSRAAPAR